MAAQLPFETEIDKADSEPSFLVDVDGFEGPLDLLLELARRQKVDLAKISVLALAEQYLAFIEEARRVRLELAADYLVMAAWLAFLKSRLLLPKPERPRGDEPPAHDLAASLAFRLAKLDAMRQAVEALKALPQTGRDVFTRGDPDAIMVVSSTRLDADLYGLIQAYVQQRRREGARRYRPMRRIDAYPLEAARLRLKSLAPELTAWTPLAGLAPHPHGEGPSRASYLASTLSAGLEMVKDGEMEARQLEAFADVFLRLRKQAKAVAP